MRKVIDVRRLGDELRRLEREAPKAVERGMREGSLMLRGALVQIEIAKADPQPVDQGQYKGAWEGRDVPGGAIVFNLTRHAAFVERGRRPGRMPPMSPIREWVRRKGLWKTRYAELAASAQKSSGVAAAAAREARAAGARSRAMTPGKLKHTRRRTLPSFSQLAAADKRAKDKILGRGSSKMGPALPRGFKRSDAWHQQVRADKASAKEHGKNHRKYAKHGARVRLKDQAINEVAMLVRRKIGNRGTKGHGILWLALRRLQPKLPGIIKRSIRELQT